MTRLYTEKLQLSRNYEDFMSQDIIITYISRQFDTYIDNLLLYEFTSFTFYYSIFLKKFTLALWILTK